MADLIETPEEVWINLQIFIALRNGSRAERSFYEKLIKSGRKFVAKEIDGEWEFGPSKFVGYKNMNLNLYEKSKQATNEKEKFDGRKTTKCLNNVLGKSGESAFLLNKFKGFCLNHDISFNFDRKKNQVKFFNHEKFLDMKLLFSGKSFICKMDEETWRNCIESNIAKANYSAETSMEREWNVGLIKGLRKGDAVFANEDDMHLWGIGLVTEDYSDAWQFEDRFDIPVKWILKEELKYSPNDLEGYPRLFRFDYFAPVADKPRKFILDYYSKKDKTNRALLESYGFDISDVKTDIRYFIGGYTWEKESHYDRFISDGVWENGYTDRFEDIVARARINDIIALKSTFAYSGKSILRISAVGRITDVHKDSMAFNVEWTEFKTPKDIEGLGKYRNTIVEITDQDEINAIFGENETDVGTSMKISMPQNIILYGPPGTGKTFSTKAYAVSLAQYGDATKKEELLLDEQQEHYKKQFKELKSKGRIEFVTFHQSFAYEDFVQGIRPDVTQSKLAFDRVDGVFKVLSDRAKRNFENSLKKKPSVGTTFEEVFSSFISELVQEEVDEIKVPMRSKGYQFAITSYDPNEGRMNFRKQSGGTSHVLLKKNIKAIYEGQLDYGIEGLGVYYYPLVDRLKEIAEVSQKQGEPEELQHYVLIIDEINRANISRVLGELITLLEPDKRIGGNDELTVRLPSGEEFSVPPNLHIIGTMNTADKSIAHLDVALRRRFRFEPVYPKASLVNDPQKKHVLKALNEAIVSEGNPDLTIGHSYFMGNETLKDIMNQKVIPLLTEYFNHRSEQVTKLLASADVVVEKDDFGLLSFDSYSENEDG